MKSVTIQVFGRVQGVGFRYLTKMVADKLNIKGTVANLDDGSVYIQAEGPEDHLNEFINTVKMSPSPSGHVEKTTIEDQSVQNFSDFRVTN
ncbi:putative nucleoside phosphatase [Pediococcus damnosus]|uniref:acylphosphatase n=1 Tax=Pediococcus damnosus TaxID=51663 RepID=A0A0R2HK43_9LACO|nr:acylphosphatase [Pediococcus damnosus]AMV61371.1 putative nucleoside phosphatase [Pediococcus damnosus]AMV62273.1 putative nucleoside phosphatase [Pediococcus damnosus]AMV65730.1 putative nucleoside phosphatase [Pediococcus damnosus]AMV67868.1 putative nucleoside phosphatase [Pediococcus damnosus]AMV70072.1 putative nucleoside phosphatase [Pediococcus damnosus]